MHSIPRSTRTLRSAAGLALLAALAVAPAAHAQQVAPAGGFDGYVGLTYGFAFGLLDGYDTCTINCPGNGGGGAAGIFAGVRAWTVPLFGGLPLYAEAGWQDFGKVKSAYYYSTPPGSGIFYATTSGNAFYAAAKLEVPISEKFSFFGRLGIAQTKVDVVGGVGAGTRLQGLGGSGTELLLGTGWQYRFAPNWSVRGDLTGFGGPRGTFAAAWNLGVAYHF